MGIDPSLNATGLALVDGTTRTLKQKASDGDFRLVNIRCDVISAIGYPNRPGLVSMEDLPRNAMGAGITGQVQGVIREVLQAYSVPYVLVSAATLKKFGSGSGRADKKQMREAWLQISGIDNPRDDEVDAAFLRLLGQYLVGESPFPEQPWWRDSVANLRPAFEKLQLGAAHWIKDGPDFVRETA
jgi:Holliday junction resolvasome RuvABC endonuclease subunit